MIRSDADKTSNAKQKGNPVFLLSFSLSCVIFIIFVFVWFHDDPTRVFFEFTPGLCGEPTHTDFTAADEDRVIIGQHFKHFDAIPAQIPGNWSRFRGNKFDNISPDIISVDKLTARSTPPILWSLELGEGHAAPAIHNGRVYILDYDEEEGADALRCFSLENGEEIWRRWYTVRIRRNHGMSRTIPAVTDSFVVTIGPRCHVMAVHAQTGDFLWGIDLEREYGTEVPLWYTGQCPLIDDTVAVIAPAGRLLMIGVHCRTGEILWETPNPGGWKMSHSSVMPMEFFGQKVYVYVARGGIVGVGAEGSLRGEILFKSDRFNHNVISTSPVQVEGNRILATAGYGAGSMMLQVKKENDIFSLEPIQTVDVQSGLAAEQQTPIYYNGHLFAVLPKDAGHLRNRFASVHPDDIGTILWSSGAGRRFGLGPFIIIGNTFFILDDHANLTIAAASISGYRELGSIKLFDGIDAWGPLAYAGGRLLIRDSQRLICLDIR